MAKKEERKITWKKKMTNADYLNMLAYVQDKELPALDDIDSVWLGTIEERSFRTTKEEKEKIEEFFRKFIGGVSLEAAIASAPKKKKPYVPPTQQVVQAPVQGVPALSNPPVNNPVVEQQKPVEVSNPAMIIPDDERWEWANADRTPDYNWDIHKQQNVKNFPFVINYNEPVSPDNIDFDMMFHMLEHGKVSANEVYALFCTNNANKMIDLKPENIGLSDRYKNEANLYCAISEGEIIGRKFLEIMNEPEPSEDETLARYKDYVMYGTEVTCDRLNECIEYMDIITNISGNKIEFATVDEEDEDMVESDYLEYATAEAMLTDLLHLSYTQKFGEQIDLNKKYSIFDKSISIKKFISDIYKKYPRGFVEGKVFYRTRREALEEGALKL